jgi:hypothetical protein
LKFEKEIIAVTFWAVEFLAKEVGSSLEPRLAEEGRTVSLICTFIILDASERLTN